MYEAYSPHSVLLTPASQQQMQTYHLIDHGWGANFLGYGLGTMVGANFQPFQECGLATIGHEGRPQASDGTAAA